MKENRSKNIKRIVAIAISIIVVAVLVIGGYFIFTQNGNIRNKLITKDNYAKITEQVTEQLKDSDDAYYFTYACVNHMSKAGLTEEYLNIQDDDILYKDIYNKTVGQLIDEGKNLMSESDMTLEKFKEQVEIINKFSNSTNEVIDENEVNEWIKENNSLINET